MSENNDSLILALDCGTQSIRAILFDLRGNLIAKSKVHLKPYYSEQPNWAEQDPNYFWDQLCKVCQQLWLIYPHAKSRLIGVALTSQRNTVVHVDINGNPLRPAIVWLDKRRTDNLPPISAIKELTLKILGLSEAISNFRRDAESNWVAMHQPDVWKSTYKQLLLSGYFNYKLCGQFVDSSANQVGYLPFNFKKKKWASKWDWKWDLQPLTLEKLPKLLPAANVLGTITSKASAQTGIPENLPLVSAAGDKACETLGAGCLHPYEGSISYGTSATFNVCGEKYIELFGYFPPYPAAVPDLYTNEYQINRGYLLIKWFVDEFGALELQKALQSNVAVESILDDMIKDIPAGNDGLILQPYWSSSFSIKEAKAKGAIIGFKDSHKKGHIYRSIIEGNAYALREGMEIISKATKVPINILRVSGGGSQSDVVMQITADIFGMAATRTHVHETAALGAAIDVAVALSKYRDFTEAVNGMVRLGRRFEPDAAATEIYQQLYAKVYRKMLDRLQPLYDQIHTILNPE